MATASKAFSRLENRSPVALRECNTRLIVFSVHGDDLLINGALGAFSPLGARVLYAMRCVSCRSRKSAVKYMASSRRNAPPGTVFGLADTDELATSIICKAKASPSAYSPIHPNHRTPERSANLRGGLVALRMLKFPRSEPTAGRTRTCASHLPSRRRAISSSPSCGAPIYPLVDLHIPLEGDGAGSLDAEGRARGGSNRPRRMAEDRCTSAPSLSQCSYLDESNIRT
mmetsp:Transcript_62839/g.185582  ORF Transcript_62839/g.185582 Transcript_62839/m.185582 type:complete len:228 (-) Transcript_62839:31-714(-)